MTYRIKWNDSVFTKGEQIMRRGLARLVTDVHAMAVTNAPIAAKKGGSLKRSGKMEVKDFKGKVTFGGGKVKYARRREYENKLHPQTKFYLRRAVKKAKARQDSYFEEEQL